MVQVEEEIANFPPFTKFSDAKDYSRYQDLKDRLRNLRSDFLNWITIGIDNDRLEMLCNAERLIGKTVYASDAEPVAELRVVGVALIVAFGDDESEYERIENIGSIIHVSLEEAKIHLKKRTDKFERNTP